MSNNKAIFILWDSASKYFDNIFKEISNLIHIEKCKILCINDYKNFIISLYEYNSQKELGVYKSKKMFNGNKDYKICVLSAVFEELDDAKYKSIVEIKNEIRLKYMNKIDNYFHDNIIHASDSEDEYNHILKTIRKYTHYY